MRKVTNDAASHVPTKDGWYLCNYKSSSGKNDGQRVRYIQQLTIREFPYSNTLKAKQYSEFVPVLPAAAKKAAVVGEKTNVFAAAANDLNGHVEQLVAAAEKLDAKLVEAEFRKELAVAEAQSLLARWINTQPLPASLVTAQLNTAKAAGAVKAPALPGASQ